jgi:hypothetical protein
MSAERFASRLILAAPTAGRAIEQVSGRLLATSLRGMRDRGLEDRYFGELDESLQATLRSVSARDWLDVSVAVAHYRTMEALIPLRADQLEIGRALATQRRNSYLLAAVTTAIRTSGISPLTVLRRSPRVWNRLFRGGGVELVQEGPREARLVLHAEPLGRIGYFQAALQGVLLAALEIVAKAPSVRFAPEPDPGVFALIASWS